MTLAGPGELARKRRRHRNERLLAAIVVATAAIAAALILRWSEKEKRALGKDQRYIPRIVTMTPEVTMLQELVRIDSSKPEGVAAAARWTAAYLESNGIPAEIIESAPSALNVYARIKGQAPGHGLILFSHLDVVPAGDDWTRPAFDASFFGDRLYGRGTIDMKALIVCQLAAFVEIAKSGRTPEHDLVFLATADEETGSRYGMQWLLAHRADVFKEVSFGITEGGLTEVMGEKMTYFGIEIGGKQLVQVLIDAPTLGQLQKTRIALEPFMFSREPERVLPEVRTYFNQLAPTRVAYRPYLHDIDRTIREGQFWRLPPTYRSHVQNSVTTAGAKQVGKRWEMEVSMLNLADEDPDKRLAWLSELVTAHGASVSRVLVKEGPGVLSSQHTPLFAILANEAKERYHVTSGLQILYRSTSDSRFLRAHGIQCYGVSPYPVTYYQSLTIHRGDEFITVGAFQDGVEYLRSVVRVWARTSAG